MLSGQDLCHNFGNNCQVAQLRDLVAVAPIPVFFPVIHVVRVLKAVAQSLTTYMCLSPSYQSRCVSSVWEEKLLALNHQKKYLFCKTNYAHLSISMLAQFSYIKRFNACTERKTAHILVWQQVKMCLILKEQHCLQHSLHKKKVFSEPVIIVNKNGQHLNG